MRVISGFLAAALLAALAQPAWAVCVIRGGARTCSDFPNWEPAAGPDVEATAPETAGDLKAIVTQPSASGDNAWVVVTPEEDGGGATPVSAAGPAAACILGVDC